MSLDPLENRVTVGAHGDVIARAVLVILRTVSRNHVDGAPRPWRIAGSAGALSDGELLERLTAMPKPVVCEVTRSETGPEISIGRPDDNPRWEWWAWAHTGDRPVFNPAEQEEMNRTGNRRVLLAGETESIVLSDDEVKQLSRDYVIIGTHTMGSSVTSRLGAPMDVAILRRYWASSPSSSIKSHD